MAPKSGGNVVWYQVYIVSFGYTNRITFQEGDSRTPVSCDLDHILIFSVAKTMSFLTDFIKGRGSEVSCIFF